MCNAVGMAHSLANLEVDRAIAAAMAGRSKTPAMQESMDSNA
jgi:hypothetical protein